MAPFAPAILVFEKKPRCEAELKRYFASSEVLIRPCRSSVDLLALCRAMPGSVVVLDLSPDLRNVLQCLEQMLTLRLGLLPVVIAEAGIGPLEWSLRELGAMAVLSETTRGDELGACCRRLLDKGSSFGLPPVADSTNSKQGGRVA